MNRFIKSAVTCAPEGGELVRVPDPRSLRGVIADA